MDLIKLQNLLNECIMIEQGNYLGGNFSVDLAEAQAELDQAKQLIIPRVVSSLTAKDKLYLNTLLINKLLEKDIDGTYKAVNDIGIMDRINDLMEKVNNS